MPWLLKSTLIVSILMAPPTLYVCWRINATVNQNFSKKHFLKWPAVIFLASLFVFPLYGIFDYYLTGHAKLLGYPKPLAYWFWFGFIFVFQLSTWFILADLLKIISKWFAAVLYERIKKIHTRALFFIFIGVALFTGWKVYDNTTKILLRKHVVRVKDLPKSLKGFKIVHISDIHGDEYTGKNRIDRYITLINKQKPDLVVFTGDLISFGTDFISMAARELGKAHSQYGTIAVVGDHDYWAGVNNVQEALNSQGITLLRDRNKMLRVCDSASISVTGITEVYSKHSKPAVVDSLMRRLQNTKLKILISHQPAQHLASEAAKHNYTLMLSGHTHGGQIRVPFLGMTFSASEMETSYISGMYHKGKLPINVNNGLGFTLAPIRYNAPAMVSVITLEGK